MANAVGLCFVLTKDDIILSRAFYSIKGVDAIIILHWLKTGAIFLLFTWTLRVTITTNKIYNL